MSKNSGISDYDILTHEPITVIHELDTLDLYSYINWYREKKPETMKRVIDVLGSFLGIILAMPAMLIIAIAIKLDSKGPVIIRQIRTGQNRRKYSNHNGDGRAMERRHKEGKGAPIAVLKFRTMFQDTALYATSPKDDHDKRITHVGKLLRKTCLDELPQLFNVLKGELSLVGPRPEMEFIVKNYNPLESLRLSVKPGITGLWQIYGSRKMLIHENLQYDLEYIQNHSLIMDLSIILRTIKFVITHKNC
ncbi:sugar transferase [candidate division KSB1 bacterium]|nr:sugar transferase [candidate division KSB1 bacterium]